MNRKVLACGFIVALVAMAACSGGTTTPATNTNSTVAKPSQSAAPATSPATEGAQDFTLVNDTGVEIHHVYISPHDSNNWEEDILGKDTLPDGQSVDIKFHRSETAAMWDLKVSDKGDHSIEWENLNLLKISKLTLNYKDGKATAIPE